MSAPGIGEPRPQDAPFMELALRQAELALSIGADLAVAAAWVNAQPDWEPLEVVAEFMRDRALRTMATFDWASAGSRARLDTADR